MTNCRSTLRHKRARPLARYDALPPDLRRWLQNAALPWSIPSAERLWRKRMAQNGNDPAEAKNWLSEVERKTLRKDRLTPMSAPAASATPAQVQSSIQ